MEGPFHDPELKLIETFGWDGQHFPRLALHLARMRNSAQALGFPFDIGALESSLPNAPGPAPLRLRLTLDRQGRFDLTASPLPPNPSTWSIIIADRLMRSDDRRLVHKTTDRAIYDQTRAALPQGIDEAIFLNERGEVSEGTITNLFFDLGDGLQTPPLNCGCLPGCLRADMLGSGAVREGIILARNLRKARLWVGNSLRGLITARLA